MALTTKQISQIQVLFAQANMDDFEKIAEMFNTTRRMLERQVGSSFSIGQQVTWIGKRGPLSGTITKINRRNIVVNAGDNGMWKVSPGLLNAA
tara:strand:+ start:2436 stop:2714 length:279 start_codon:yes stop_codon:yes gene_type:complete